MGTFLNLGARVRALPLTVKLLGTILGLAIVPLLMFAYFGERTARDILLDSKREDLHTHAEGVMAALDNTMGIRRTEAATMAKGPMVVAYADDPGNPKNAQPLLGAFQTLMSAQPNIKAIFVADAASGAVTLSTTSNLGRNLGNRTFIKAAAAGDSSISEPSRDDGVNFVYYASPVRDRSGRLSHVMVLGIAADELWEIIRTETGRLGNGTLAVMTDDAGVRIGHSTTAGLEFQSWVPLEAATARALVGEQRYGADVTEITSTEYGDVATRVTSPNPPPNITEHRLAVSDETYESGIARSHLKPWTIIESVPHSTFMTPVERLRLTIAVIIAAAVIIITLLVLMVSRVALLPIRQLLASVERMNNGDLSTPVPLIPDKEMGTLAQGFNSLRRKVSTSYDELQRGYIDLARALVASLEARDPYTAGHTERVGQYALALSRKLGLRDEEIVKIRKAAELHDIGKACVPDSVLLKPDRLTPGEFAEIQRHPGKSGEIVHHLGFLREVVPLIDGHHERYDGNGYPKGLSGPEIPLGARILAVADAYDAMTSKRAYRDALSHEKAMMILEEGAGTQWDANIVKAFIEMMDDKQSAA